MASSKLCFPGEALGKQLRVNIRNYKLRLVKGKSCRCNGLRYLGEAREAEGELRKFGFHYVDIVGVTGSIPVAPTNLLSRAGFFAKSVPTATPTLRVFSAKRLGQIDFGRQ